MDDSTQADKSSRKARLALLTVYTCLKCVNQVIISNKTTVALEKNKHLKQAVSHPSTVWPN